VSTRGKGTYEVTRELRSVLAESGISDGMISVFCHHTSCSLVLMENADPTARNDLEAFFDKLVPENLPYFRHIYEGPDDMPSHIKMALTRSSETMPVMNGQIVLGTWQGVFLWEHRAQGHYRKLTVSVIGD